MSGHLLDGLPNDWSAHGLTFTRGNGTADVTVRCGELMPGLEAPSHSTAIHDVADGVWLARLSRDIRLQALEGTRITVHAPESADPGDIARWVLGSATTAILHQRRILALHASAVVVGDRAVAFLAPSGTGKSSLAAALVASGGQPLTDDLLAIRQTPAGTIEAWPGGPGLRVPPATWERLDQGRFDLIRVDPDHKRLAWPRTPILSGSRPLSGLFFLRIGDAVRQVRLPAVSVVTRLRALVSLPMLLRRLGGEAECFTLLGAIASQVPAWVLTRPSVGNSLDQLVSLVTATETTSSRLEAITDAQRVS